MALLEIRNLGYRYDGRPAVRGVSFAVERGEFFGLLGPNGAGKTTTISCICGLLSRYEGEILFDGRPFRPAHEVGDRARIGLVPQEIALYGHLTARENLAFFGRIHGLQGSALRSAVAEALDIAGLAERADDRVAVFSGGMKRRLNLVVAVLHDPELLVLDEPTVGVDPQSRHHIFEALQRLTERGKTLLYTTHYMEEAERLCSRLAVLDDGRVLAEGSAAELAAAIGAPDSDLERVFLHLTGKRLRDT